MVRRRRRGTVIVDTPKGILVVNEGESTYYLPGGGARMGESRRNAAMRELGRNRSKGNKLFLSF